MQHRRPLARSDASRFLPGAPLWFHVEFQGFSLRYDVNDVLDWEPMDEARRPRFSSLRPEDFLHRRPDWQNYDMDDEKSSAMRAAWAKKMTERRERWFAEVAELSAERQAQFASERKRMLASAEAALADPERIARCMEAHGRAPLRRSNQAAFASGAGLGFHIYVQGFDPELDVDDVYQGVALLTRRPRARIVDVKDALGCFDRDWDNDYDISEVEPGLIVKALRERVARMSCPFKAKLSFNYPYA